jgi:hypothetical protein
MVTRNQEKKDQEICYQSDKGGAVFQTQYYNKKFWEELIAYFP